MYNVILYVYIEKYISYVHYTFRYFSYLWTYTYINI